MCSTQTTGAQLVPTKGQDAGVLVATALPTFGFCTEKPGQSASSKLEDATGMPHVPRTGAAGVPQAPAPVFSMEDSAETWRVPSRHHTSPAPTVTSTHPSLTLLGRRPAVRRKPLNKIVKWGFWEFWFINHLVELSWLLKICVEPFSFFLGSCYACFRVITFTIIAIIQRSG